MTFENQYVWFLHVVVTPLVCNVLVACFCFALRFHGKCNKLLAAAALYRWFSGAIQTIRTQQNHVERPGGGKERRRNLLRVRPGRLTNLTCKQRFTRSLSRRIYPVKVCQLTVALVMALFASFMELNSY